MYDLVLDKNKMYKMGPETCVALDNKLCPSFIDS